MIRFKRILILACGAVLLLFSTAGQAAEIAVPGEFPTIQAAIDAAQPGDIVVVQPGRYQERIRVAQKVTVLSAGDATPGKIGLARAEATIIDAGGKSPAVIMEDRSAIDGLTVTGAGRFDQAEFDKHYAERGENLPDERGAVGAGGGGAAVSIDGVTARVANCIVHDNGQPGIGLSGDAAWSAIKDNHVYRNMGGGIGIADGADGRISGNRCWNNLRAGIGCRNAAPTIEDNHCFENVRAGIGNREGATPIVRRNHCYKNRRAGIGVRMAGTEPQIHWNKCYENGMAGIGCRDGAAPIIVGNECYKNRLAGIGAMSNARPTITDNKIYENEAAAIGLDACESGEALIHRNHIVAKKLVCIGIQSGWSVSVEDNQISRKGGLPPLVMVFEGARADFTGNQFEGSGVAAIRSQGQIFVCDNHFNCPAPRKGGGPPQNAVWALDGSMASVTDDNQIVGWRKTDHPCVRVESRAELDAALREAKAGTTILIDPGDYPGGVHARDLHGAKGKPIVITGALRAQPPVFQGGNSGLHLTDPRHVELRNFVISGAKANGLNIDDGGTFASPAEGVKLSGLVVRDIGGRGNHDGIKLSGLRDFRVDFCTLERWGDSGSAIDMVGCHDGVVFGSVFSHKPDAVSANGVQAKGGSRKIAIRRCQFRDAGGRAVNLGGSTGADYFRPKDAGSEAAELLVEDCVFRGSMAPVAFVGVDGAIVRNNTILRPGRWILRILQENSAPHLVRCRNGRFERNAIRFSSDQVRTAVNIGANTLPQSFLLTENHWQCSDGKSAAEVLSPFPIPASDSFFVEEHEPSEIEADVVPWYLGRNAGVRWSSLPEEQTK